MKISKTNQTALVSLLVMMLLVSANVSAQRRGGGGGGVSHPSGGGVSHPSSGGGRYQPVFGGGQRAGSGYYAPRSTYRYVGPGYGASRFAYHPRYSVIGYGGFNYGYYNGLFYAPYGFGYHLIFPPIGIRIGILPYGYFPFYFGVNPYYYYGGVFYSPYYDGGYQVTTPPLGAQVPELPAGAKSIIINGQQFFEYYGTFYQRITRENGEIWFRVVGRNGRLETGQPQYDQQYQPAPYQQQPYQQQPAQPQYQQPAQPQYQPAPQQQQPAQPQQQQPTQPQQQQPAQTTPQSAAPVVGDLLFKLPDGCKTLTVNGEQYYQSPAGDYFQEVIGDDNKILYQMVDKNTIQAQQAPAPTNGTPSN